MVHEEQLKDWYNNLAPGLKFPLGPDPVLDPHKAFLKGQYYCLLMIAKWSFVVRLITNDPMDEERRRYITQHGRECMESIVLYVHAVERMMMFRQIMLFANFYGYVVFSLHSWPDSDVGFSLYCLVLGLLVTYRVKELRDIQIDGVEIAIIKGYLALKTWEKNPSIGVCVQRISNMMVDLNIPLQLPNPFAPHP
jgi:hypothetical protein